MNSEASCFSPPRRFIFTPEDMNQFRNSTAKRDLLSFVSVLGKSTSNASYEYDSSQPLKGLSPGMAALHGSLSEMAKQWLKDLPPRRDLGARFGNPIFRSWHKRLSERSWNIIECIMTCHLNHVIKKCRANDRDSSDTTWSMDVLEICSEEGRKAVQNDKKDDGKQSDVSESPSEQTKVIIELQAYLNHAFGHEIRIDYGTGHECSFYVFLFALCKIGVFGNIPKTTAPSPEILAPVALSITDQYLKVCREIQTDYMLEPAGSHGVWGLDDYHCIPFYIGACQMQNPVYYGNYSPSSIHDDGLLVSTEGSSMLYFQCIRYIKTLKKGVPFFESSPMLDDISRLGDWGKVSGGLLRLFEGEVLDKKPVVQHFFFGNMFKATWIPSKEPHAPVGTFADSHSMDSVAPWALKNTNTRAP